MTDTFLSTLMALVSVNMTLNSGTSQVVVSLTANVQRTTLCQ